jgi:uncharacterized protein (DUF885 family)
MFFSSEIAHHVEVEPRQLFIIQPEGANALSSTGSAADRWFGGKPNPDLYWEALIQVAKGNREAARNIVESIQSARFLPAVPEWKKEYPDNLDAFFDKLFLSEVSNRPQELSFIGLLDSIGIREHNACLNDVSIDACRKALAQKKVDFQCLQKYSSGDLTADQKQSYDVFYWKLAHEIEGEKFLFHDYRISQSFVGILAEVNATFTQFHKLEIDQDVENYILRLACLPTQLKQTVETMEYQRQQGIFPPRFAIQKALNIIAGFLASDIADNFLYTRLAEQINGIDIPDRSEKLSRAAAVIQNQVCPSYRLLQIYCQNLLNEVPSDHGVWALPDGDAYYAHMLKGHTTTDLTADEIHELGLKEISRIEEEMRGLLARQGFIDPSKGIGALMQDLSNSSNFYYPNTPEGREECLADFYAILERSREKLWPLFGITPKFPVSILAVPKHEEGGMPAAYYHSPSIDGSRPGVFYVNLRNMQEISKCRMETLAIHEAEPGHHFQLSIQMESDVPVLRKIDSYTSYAEGWALYTEKLAYENGFYTTPSNVLSHLQDELLRAIRLVVDTGIHKKRWSKERAVGFMKQHLCSNHDSIVSEIERYFVAPGQACGYKIGQLKILELRQKAKDQLNDKFDIREFHDAVLGAGSVPLTILEDVVNRYVKERNVSSY